MAKVVPAGVSIRSDPAYFKTVKPAGRRRRLPGSKPSRKAKIIGIAAQAPQPAQTPAGGNQD